MADAGHACSIVKSFMLQINKTNQWLLIFVGDLGDYHNHKAKVACEVREVVVITEIMLKTPAPEISDAPQLYECYEPVLIYALQIQLDNIIS